MCTLFNYLIDVWSFLLKKKIDFNAFGRQSCYFLLNISFTRQDHTSLEQLFSSECTKFDISHCTIIAQMHYFLTLIYFKSLSPLLRSLTTTFHGEGDETFDFCFCIIIFDQVIDFIFARRLDFRQATFVVFVQIKSVLFFKSLSYF